MFTSDGCEMTDQAKQNRRNFVTSMMGGSLAAAAAAGRPAAEAQAESQPPEGLSADDAMAHYWNKPLSELVDIGPYNATPAEMERHRVYANLVLALLHGYFNGNKDGETGEYPWQPSQRIAGTGTQSLYAGGRYLGDKRKADGRKVELADGQQDGAGDGPEPAAGTVADGACAKDHDDKGESEQAGADMDRVGTRAERYVESPHSSSSLERSWLESVLTLCRPVSITRSAVSR